MKSVQPLVQSAEKLGYRVYKLQAETAQNRHDCVLLMNSRGNRMLIERSSAGRLQLTTAGNMANMSTLVRQHTVDRTLEHLKATHINRDTFDAAHHPNTGIAPVQAT